MNDFSPRNNQSGVALLLVIGCFSILMVIVSQIIISSQSILDRGKGYIEYQQASLLCLSGEEVARQMLYLDFQRNPDIDFYGEDWSKSGIKYQMEGGYYEISIRDAQGRLNINSLYSGKNQDDQKYQAVFRNLINSILDDPGLSMKIGAQFVDWVDDDKSGEFEASSYSVAGLSYAPSNRLMVSASEIRLLKDVDSVTYHLLRPLVENELSVLPTSTKININTVTPDTLSALEMIDINEAKLLANRIHSSNEGFRTPQEALSGITSKNLSLYDVKSSYFEVRVRARFGDQYAYLSSLIFRDPAKNGRLNIIHRDFSKRFIFEFSEDYNEPDRNRFEINI